MHHQEVKVARAQQFVCLACFKSSNAESCLFSYKTSLRKSTESTSDHTDSYYKWHYICDKPIVDFWIHLGEHNPLKNHCTSWLKWWSSVLILCPNLKKWRTEYFTEPNHLDSKIIR